VGRWGEEFVSRYLRSRVPPGYRVDWVNEVNETGFSYDIVVLDPSGAVDAYVEVKATATQEKTFFEFSHKEWLYAQREGDAYHIYRVYGAGTPDARVARIVNPYLQWRSQKVGMCLAL
jgi:hypothetical protein